MLRISHEREADINNLIGFAKYLKEQNVDDIVIDVYGMEDMINYTNTRYEEMGLALIQKVPTPITPVRIDKERRHITLAYFDKVSTVDYIGAVQGIPICFDAKECAADTFPLQNVHEHQVSFMEKYEKQQGISFLIIYYFLRCNLLLNPI